MKTIFRRAVLLMLVTVLIAPAAVSGQEATIPVKLTPYAGNPVLVPDPATALEEGAVAFPRVFFQDGQYHMLYLGYSKFLRSGSVNYATSSDGLEWTRYTDNPVFVPDEEFAPKGLMQFAVLPDDDRWLMYFVPWTTTFGIWYDLPPTTYLATAPEITGPWTVAPEPVFTRSSPLEWDGSGRWIWSILKENNAYLMYYAGIPVEKIGWATSPNGIQWTKYNDPTTTTSLLANSDPVFGYDLANRGAWDRLYLTTPVITPSTTGYEMFYAGGSTYLNASIGYATSPDGFAWTRVGDEPVLKTGPAETFWPTSAIEVDGTEYLYYTVANNGTPKEIAVATIERQ